MFRRRHLIITIASKQPICMTQSYNIKSDNSKCLDHPSGGDTILDKSEQVRNVNNGAVFRKRAYKKYLSIKLVKKLIALESPMQSAYERIFDCCRTIKQKDGKMTSQYCGDRWCKVCGSIRTARAIDGYGEQLKALKDKQFLTLTAPNVKEDELAGEIKRMIKVFRRIKDMARKDKIHIKGLRKLECTCNLTDDIYNPHFHCIIEGKEAARYILDGWMDRNPDANRGGQCLKDADDESVEEMTKYTFKLPVDPDDEDEASIRAMDIIFMALRRRRTLQPFGGLKAVKEEIEPEDLDAVIETDEAFERAFVWHDHDWYDIDTGEPLSGYMPDERPVKRPDKPPEANKRGSPNHDVLRYNIN